MSCLLIDCNNRLAEYTKFYQDCANALENYKKVIELCKEFETMDCVSRECGIDVGAADHPLISVIRNVHTGDRDCNELWSLLPFAYGSSFASKYWAVCKQVSTGSGRTEDLVVVFCDILFWFKFFIEYRIYLFIIQLTFS